MKSGKQREKRRPSFSDLEDWVTPEQVRQFLNLSRSTVYELLKQGVIPSKPFGRQLRIPKTALDPAGK
jgi:excisionase family DNA binding protein